MLKFETASPDRQINIIVRDKERVCTRAFGSAFAIALALHFSFLILFQISPFKLLFSETILPPSQVEADLSLSDAVVMSQVEHSRKLVSGLPPPRLSVPTMPEHPAFLAVRHVEYIKEKNSEGNPFIQIEKEIYHPGFTPLAKLPPHPLEIKFSGPIAAKDVLNNGLHGKRIPSLRDRLAAQEGLRVIYAVLVEGRSGRVFWYEPKQSSGIALLDRFAEGVLKDCCFAKDQETFIVAGEIELHFNFSSRDTP